MKQLIKQLKKYYPNARINTAKDMITSDGKFLCWLSEGEIKELIRMNEDV